MLSACFFKWFVPFVFFFFNFFVGCLLQVLDLCPMISISMASSVLPLSCLQIILLELLLRFMWVIHWWNSIKKIYFPHFFKWLFYKFNRFSTSSFWLESKNTNSGLVFSSVFNISSSTLIEFQQWSQTDQPKTEGFIIYCSSFFYTIVRPCILKYIEPLLDVFFFNLNL